MRLSWIFFIGLLVVVAIFSVQNAAPITVQFLNWKFTLSAALVIQLAVLAGCLVGIGLGFVSRRRRPPPDSDSGGSDVFHSE